MTTPPILASHPLAPFPGTSHPTVIGMVHLLPLPGSPGWRGSMAEVVDRAMTEAQLLASAGFHGVMVENYGDTPFLAGPLAPETVAALAVVARRVREASGLPVGVNALRNDPIGALGVAVASGASCIRVNVHVGAMWTDQGLLQGGAAETLRRREALRAPVAILADVLVKHAHPPVASQVGAVARETWERGRADGLILTGEGTGAPTELATVRAVRAAVPEARLWVGSGVTPATVHDTLAVADGVIVGSALHREGVAGRGLDPERVARLAEAAGAGRGPAR